MSKKQLGELDAKVKTLHLRLKNTDLVVEKREKEAIERQRAAISALSGEIDCLRGSIQEGKFVAGESEKDVESWSEDIGTNLVTADEHVGSLTEFLKEIKTETRDLKRDQNHAKEMT